MSKILITGATGFIGHHAVIACQQAGLSVLPLARDKANPYGYQAAEITPQTDWSAHLQQVDVIVHCAARVHVMNDKDNDPLTAYRDVNTDGTLHFARQAAAAGVKRFIFLSSIKVNGEATTPDTPFTARVEQAPTDPYGLSKYEAEKGLLALAQETGMDVVIIRPPLVYGPGVKANFASLLHCVRKGLPLPLGAINNKRSFVYIDNLVDLILTCVSHPNAANQTFLVSDDDDVSTSELLRQMAYAMGKTPRLLPIPQIWLMALTRWLGKPGIGERLCGDLQLDIDATKTCLDWHPPYNLADALQRMINQSHHTSK
ncbi:SDR family oxidoreductase [Photobacterium japonica]|uniref:UDP-glucose 4-epimerase family protein n=1 Tax=Photobacterium japonica TaxID=2910235 RepID=UPI003D137204